MQKKYLLLLIVFFLMIFYTPDSPKAKEEEFFNRDKIFQFLSDAFHAQISLSEADRSLEEIKNLLDPYFSSEFQMQFLKANLYEENGKYFTYGTDFGEYFIPFFDLSDSTKIVKDNNSIYVFEFFPKLEEGPITYEDHYEGILLKKIEGKWKISELLFNTIPKNIIQQGNI